MRLILTRLPYIQLIEVGEEKILKGEITYAIFSHRWGEDEATFQDVTNTANQEALKETRGYQKIKSFCAVVASEYEYAWVDTCCINKESSAELSEAINSMYRWYQLAGRCYAYLHDVPFTTDDDQLRTSFNVCQWFKRGWTLQELIAPRHVTFLSGDWKNIGSNQSLCNLVSQVTLIEEPILLGQARLGSVSVAKRMSWAASRKSTRIEDVAYCLMGIFDVHMPLLYGEGEKAFIRLQEEIIKDSDDQTIFAWECLDDGSQYRGFLARSPSLFINSGGIVPFSYSDNTLPFELSNRGIRFSQSFIVSRQASNILVLSCQDHGGSERDSFIGVPLRRTDGQATYCRASGTLHKHITWTKLHYAEHMTIYAHKTSAGINFGSNGIEKHFPKETAARDGSKNLILLIDYEGPTAQEENMSNLRSIHQLVCETDISQRSYYDMFCPVSDDLLQVCVEKAYGWLTSVYGDGDRVFLFGYSAGGRVVQAIAQILENIGVHSGCRHRNIWARYQIWRSEVMGTNLLPQADSGAVPAPHPYHCKPTVKVTFMGLFDAVDIPCRRQPMRVIELQWTTPAELPSEVTHPARVIRHAISLDERDPQLQPIFVGDPMPKGTQSIEQVWFAGDHHHLGGISPGSASSLLSAHPLTWMTREAVDAGMGVNHAAVPGYLRDHEKEDYPVIGMAEYMDIAHFSVPLGSWSINLFRHISDNMPANFSGYSQLPVSLLTLVPDNISMMDMLPSCVIDVPSRSVKIVHPRQFWRDIPARHKVHRSVVGYLMTRSGYLPRNLVPRWFVQAEWEQYCNSEDHFVDLWGS